MYGDWNGNDNRNWYNNSNVSDDGNVYDDRNVYESRNENYNRNGIQLKILHSNEYCRLHKLSM